VKQRISTLVTSGVLALASQAFAVAGPFDDAVAAYQRGDYAAAMSSPRRRTCRLPAMSGPCALSFLSRS
jgi:hypothetical protein